MILSSMRLKSGLRPVAHPAPFIARLRDPAPEACGTEIRVQSIDVMAERSPVTMRLLPVARHSPHISGKNVSR